MTNSLQILLHADASSVGSQAMAEHLQQVVSAALGRFGERVTRVEIYLSDADGQSKAGAGSIHCTLEARLVGLDNVVVADHADDAHQAIEGGVRKLKRAVGAAIAKHDPRQHRAKATPAADEASADAPADVRHRTDAAP